MVERLHLQLVTLVTSEGRSSCHDDIVFPFQVRTGIEYIKQSNVVYLQQNIYNTNMNEHYNKLKVQPIGKQGGEWAIKLTW